MGQHNHGSTQPPSSGIRRRRLLQLSALAAAALMANPGRAQPALSSAALKIGFTGPLSGPDREIGLDIRRGVLMALMDARAEGEIPVVVGNRRHNIDPVWIDSGSNPDQAVAATIRAITQDKVAMLVGGWHSDVALALMDAESPYGIVHLGHLGEAQSIAERINRAYGKYRGWFKGWPSPTRLAARYDQPLQYLRDQGLWRPATDQAAIMVENSAYGRSWGEALRSSLQSIGFSVGPVDLTDLEQSDFSELLTRYRQQQVSLVAMSTTDIKASASFVRQFREQQVPALLLGHGLRWTRDWYAYTADNADYVVAMDSPMPIALWQQWWVNRYRRLLSDMPSMTAGLHYDYTRMAVRVLNKTASLELEDMIRTIYRSPYRGVWNRYRFASSVVPEAVSANEVMTGPFMEGFFFPMTQLFDGEARTIWPPRYADQRFLAPPWV